MTFRYRSIGLIAAIPTWLAIGMLTVFTAIDALGRLIFNDPVWSRVRIELPDLRAAGSLHPLPHEAVSQYSALLLLIALPAAALFVCLEGFSRGLASTDSDIRSSLGVWPGLPLAILGLLAAVAGWQFSGIPLAALWVKLLTSLEACSSPLRLW